MAAPKQSPDPLTYKVNDLATIKAECERLIPASRAGAGVFRNTGNAQVKQLPGSTDALELVLERTVTGYTKGAEEQIAFTAFCKVACIVTFSRDQGENLPEGLLRALVTPLFYVASERCRNLVVSMGFPPPAIGAMTKFSELTGKAASDSAPKSASEPVQKAARKRKIAPKVGT